MDLATARAKLAELFASHAEIHEAYVFGSAARGDDQPHSDIDVAVHVDWARAPSGPFGYLAAMTTELIGVLGTQNVDLTVLNAASPMLYHRVLRDGQRVYSRSLVDTTTREAQALSRYCDLVPHLERVDRLLSRVWEATP